MIDKTHDGVTVKLNLWGDVLESKSFRLSRSRAKYIACKFSENWGFKSDRGRDWRSGSIKSERFRYLGSILQNN